MSSLRRTLARQVLRASGLPSFSAAAIDPETEVRFRTATDRLEAGDAHALGDLALLPFLQWLAQERGVLFHGSIRDDFYVLEPVRLSRDATPFGDQQAVYASSDPVWAIYFASLRRGNGLRGTRNASLGIAGERLYPRWYFFSLNKEALGEGRFGPETIYVVPREPFLAQPPGYGVLDSAQWVAPDPVRPRFRMKVDPADFPFVHFVVAHRPWEPMLATMIRAAAHARRRRRTHP
jgi:hypothetical protein